jgi:hypothetical protein
MVRQLMTGLVVMMVSVPAAAQGPSGSGRLLAEASVGHAAFIDSPPVPHVVVAAAARVYVAPRLAIGPEVTWMRGPGADRDTFITGNATWDLRAPSSDRGSVVPYLVGGGGLMRHTGEVGTGLFTSTEATFTAGGGLRLTSRSGWFVAPEVRLGWELHRRVGVVVGCCD